MKRLLATFLAALTFCALCVSPAFAAGGVPEPVLSAVQSVVRIQAEYAGSYVSGTGFVIGGGGQSSLIATNYHVVEDEPLSISIWLAEGEKVSAKILASSPEQDLCILETSLPLSLPALTFSGDTARQGAAVYAVGFPAAADSLFEAEAYTSSDATITSGIVSTVRQTTIQKNGPAVDLLQISAAINPGNSGGPLFDTEGHVVGVNTFGIGDAEGIYGALAAGELTALMEENGIAPVLPGSGGPSPLLWAAAALVLLALILIPLLLVRKKRRGGKHSSARSRSLTGLLAACGRPLTPEEAVTLLMPVALELRDLHNTGAAYLELSPARVALSRGHARLLEKSGGESARYSSGYAAPEIYRGGRGGPGADQYSFCALLQYAVSGVEPENALERESAPDAALPPLDLDRPELGPIIARGMALDPAARFPSMAELISALIPFRSGAPLPIAAPEAPAASPPEMPPEAPETPPRRKKRVLAAVLVPVCLLVLLGGFAGSTFLCYNKAQTLAERGEYSSAQKYMICEPLTNLLDKDFPAYLSAGVQLENQDYAAAAGAFIALSGYRDADNMVLEAQYQQAAQLANQDEFDQAIAAYEALAEKEYKDSADLVLDTRFRRGEYLLYELKKYTSAYAEFVSLQKLGHPDAESMLNEVQYCLALDLIDQELYEKALYRLSLLSGYKDADTVLLDLQEMLYSKGQKYYWDKNYSKADKFFSLIPDYKDSFKYQVLIEAHLDPYYYHTPGTTKQWTAEELRTLGMDPEEIRALRINQKISDKAIEALKKLGDFEDAAELLRKYTS